VRADGHVAWRGNEKPSEEQAKEIWDVVLGWKRCLGYQECDEEGVEFMIDMTRVEENGHEKNGVQRGVRNGELAFE